MKDLVMENGQIYQVMNKKEAIQEVKDCIERFQEGCFDEEEWIAVTYEDDTYAVIYHDEIIGNDLTKKGLPKLQGIKTMIQDCSGVCMSVYGDYVIVDEGDRYGVYDRNEVEE